MSRVIGRALLRPDGRDKVSGRAQYVADLDVPGAWVGATVRSPVACGQLVGLERDPAFAWDDVVLVTPEDVPGENHVAMIAADQPVLCGERIEHYGEPLALIAAPDPDRLAAALRAVRCDVRESPAVLDMQRAEHCFKEIRIEKGDVDAAFAAAQRTLEGTYFTDSQEQMYIETQGFVAWPADADGVVEVRGSLQCPHYVQRAVAVALGVEPAQVRVVQAVTGGGFGGKEDHPSLLACHAALLARKAGRPVRMIYDRHEDLAYTPKRHPSRVHHETAFADDGTLLAMKVDVLFDGGAYTTLSPVVLSRGCIHAAGPYRCEHVRIVGRAVKTNHLPYGAFRGFGAPQVCFAVERQMDRIARELGQHPARLRRINHLRPGDTTATGQKLVESVGAEPVLDAILERTRFDEHDWGVERQGRKRRGIGFSFFYHGAGFTGSGEELLKGRVAVELQPDARVLVRASSTEFGQGTIALLRAIAAESLEIDPELVDIEKADTGLVPDSGPTVASRTCMIVGGCLERACRTLRERVGADADGSWPARARTFLQEGGDRVVEVVYASPEGLVWDDENYRGDAYPAYGWAADVAEVEVDLDTFEVRVTKFWSAADVGKALQPQLVEGQIEGGSLQAIGFAHLEVVETREGRFRQDRMATCIIPTSLDAPPMEIELVEVPFPNGPFGAKGVGEMPMDGGAPAVAAAIEDAIGIAVDRVPATPERLLAAWLAAHPEDAL